MSIANSVSNIVYGGSFDPPHLGHKALADLVLRAYPEACLRIMPSAAPAGAKGQHKSVQAEFSDRLAMCRILFPSHPRLLIDELESQLPAPNYTVQTLRVLRDRYPSVPQWFLLMGEDQWQSFADWQRPEEIVSLCSLLVVARESMVSATEVLDRLSANFGLDYTVGQEGLYHWPKTGQSLRFWSQALSKAASRKMRLAIHSTESRSWLSPELAQYINDHQLYQKG